MFNVSLNHSKFYIHHYRFYTLLYKYSKYMYRYISHFCLPSLEISSAGIKPSFKIKISKNNPQIYSQPSSK